MVVVEGGPFYFVSTMWLARFSLVCFHHPFDLNKVS